MKVSAKVKLPEDGTLHRSWIEWWYFNGHLTDGEGRKYAYMNCLFKADPKKIKIPFSKYLPSGRYFYFAHHILSDIKRQKSYPVVKPVCIVTKDSFTDKSFDVSYSSPLTLPAFMASEMSEIEPGHFHMKNENLDLHLRSKKPALLEGGTGLVDINTHKTYYYSYTDLETEGVITIGGKRIKVKGQSWFDHEWSDAHAPGAEWTWFSMHLNNDVEIICFDFAEKEKHTRLASIMLPNNKTLHTSKVEFIDLKDHWTGPKTKTIYPLSWQIKIPKYGVNLVARPLIRGQEMLYGFLNYWEGPLAIKGTFRGKAVSGKGFLELVGRPIAGSRLKVVQEQIAEAIKKTAARK